MTLKKRHLLNGSRTPSMRVNFGLVNQFLHVAALLALCSLLATAQVKTPFPQPADAKADSQNKKLLATSATDLLLTVAEGSRKWDNYAAAANIQAQVADLLWDENSDVARNYLVKAWETTSSITDARQERSSFRNESQKTQARREVLLIARRRAPVLAKKWLEEMAEEAKQEDDTKRGIFDNRTARSSVLLQMALASLESHPDAAAELAIESLNDGISFELQNVLIGLQAKDFRLAEKVFRMALTRLQTVGMLDPGELLILHSYLYTPGMVLSANGSNNSGSNVIAIGRDRPRITIAAELSPQLALQFLKVSAALLLNAAPPSTTSNPEYTARAQLSVINALMGKLTEYLPDEAVALQTKARQITTEANYTVTQAPRRDTPESLPAESAKSYAQRRVNDLEEIAEKTSDSLSRDIAYAKAALATDAEQYQRGWSLAKKIDDESLRENISNWLSYRAALHFAKLDDLDRVYELSRKNNDLLQHAACLVVGAQKLFKAKDTSRARQWLDEARLLIRRVKDPDADMTQVMLGMVSTYAQIDKWQALELLSDTIKVVNKTPEANYHDNDRAPLIRRFSGFGVLADFTYGTSGFSLRSALHAFPEDEFYDIVYKLNELLSPETRGQAIVLLCQKQLALVRERSTIKPKITTPSN